MNLQTMLTMQLVETTHAGNTHVGLYDVAPVFSLLKGDEICVQGYKVKTLSHRYQQFRRSCKCVKCGVVGTLFCLDVKRRGKGAHFNLYGIKPSGRVVMLTKDHIVPKSKGGKNHLSNYQTMCELCNGAKGDLTSTPK